jgi:RNA polymerase sigma-70 factor (ECF subfamily)
VESDDDDALMERFRGGDQKAFATLVGRYHKPIYNAAFWILRRAEDASDVTQTVFMKVVERSDGFDPQFKFFSWIYRIAVNEALNLQRRHGRDDPIDDDFDAPDLDAPTPDEQLDQAQRARHLEQAMLKLSTTDRVALTLRHFSECSYQEMAHILMLDEKTVKSRLFDARRRLRGQLGDLA